MAFIAIFSLLGIYAYNSGTVITETNVYERENGKTIAYKLSDIDRYVIREIPDYTGKPEYEVTFFFLGDKSFKFETNESSRVMELAMKHKDMIAKE